MQIVRAFWGDMNPTYSNQIMDSINDKLNEIVYVWGKENYEFITSKGFMCVLVSEEPYDYTISSAHTMYDQKNLNHKLVAIDLATKDFGEIIFIDWDCHPIKELDKSFFDILRNGGPLRVPLYVYPKHAIDWLIEKTRHEPNYNFFMKFKHFVHLHSYEWEDNFIIPNTGFIYCRDHTITTKLIELSNQHKLESVPDEFAVMVYAKELGLSLEDYIKTIEPSGISGKEHNEDWWIKEQDGFNQYASTLIEKVLYFRHY